VSQGANQFHNALCSAGLLLLISSSFALSGKLAIQKIKPSANPPHYVAFSRRLPPDKQFQHALDRLTFGPRPGDLEHVRALGLKTWLDLQLHPDQLTENPTLQERLAPLASVQMSVSQTVSVRPLSVIAGDLSEVKLIRAIYSNHQLLELLDDFWFNHFNVFFGKGVDRFTLPAYERDAIRRHVLGKFYDLLLATAESPTMLFYLDNWQSAGPGFAARHPNQKNRRGLNENYGRELLELHTLGVNGGYTQKDVIEVARCFTGWTITAPRQGGAFQYNDKMHDKGKKIVLGHVIPPGGGMGDGIEVLNILAHHPSTAHFISLKLAQCFVADDPPPSLVNRMTQTFLKTGGDLGAVMQTMFSSGEFWSEGAYRAKIKTPFEMVVSAVRAANANVTSASLLSDELQKLGEPLYRKIEPTGYSLQNADWVSSAGLLERMNYAVALAHNRIPGVQVDIANWQALPQPDPMNLAHSLLQQDPTAQTQAAIEKALASMDPRSQVAQNPPNAVPSLIAGLTLGSPEFQRR